ncbi:MFS transporter [Phytoactinopolyspora mesophila]|uniref:Uncharacterized protein n=1 Tax=Phytoactinopolyspora mesophila TaxID=2650750 RepID=A0A7K3MCI9_9ACTN|nr:MFS transporter [Phytoactinopolyspora mesophila]NDL60964.1 hypothetical protein [Phytoactinopolyspora mesophila]
MSLRVAFHRAVLVAIMVGISFFGFLPSAWSICEGDPPAPKSPDSGMPGWFVDPVDVDVSSIGDLDDAWTAVENQPDPFTEDDVSLVDTYGYGYHWGTYDLGCGPNALRDPAAIAFTGIANFIFDMGLLAGAASQAVSDVIFDSPLSFLNSTISVTQASVLDQIWTVWFPITIIMVGIYLVTRSRRAEFSDTSTAALVLVVVLVASVYFLSWPLRALGAADAAISEGVQAVTTTFSEERLEEDVARNIYYPAWLRGQLGSDTSVAAQRYGPELFWTQHYTWTEVALIRLIEDKVGDEDDLVRELAVGAIASAKMERYAELAAEIQEDYPGAYDYLRGKESTDRIGTAAIQTVYSFAAAFFYLVAMAFLLLAMMVVRGFIIGFPIAGILGAYPPARAVLSRLWDIVTAAIWNVVKFAFGAGLYLVVGGALLRSDMNVVWQIFILIVLTIALMMILRPLRSLKTMTPGLDPNRSYMMALARRMGSYRSVRRATRQGVEEARNDNEVADSADDDQPSEERPRRRQRAESDVLDPIPDNAGASNVRLELEPARADDRSHPEQPMPPIGPGPHEPQGGAHTPPQRPEGAPGVHQAAIRPGEGGQDFKGGNQEPTPQEVPVRVTLERNEPMPVRPVPNVGSGEVGRPDQWAVGETRPDQPLARQIAVSSGGSRSLADAQPSSANAGAADRAEDAATDSTGRRSSHVIKGEVVEPVYRRGNDTVAEPAELDVADPVIDENGQQVYVIYKREQV